MNLIVFDAMGVTFKVGDDINNLLIPFLRKRDKNLSAGKVHELYAVASIGKITSYQFWKELGFEKDYPAIEMDYLDQCLEVDPGFVPCARTLKPNYHLAMLSNDVKEWSEHLRDHFHLKQYFELAVISGAVGFRKPDPAIYRELLKRADAEASQCLFIDDHPRNLAPAREMGFKTVMFSRPGGDDPGDFPYVRSFEELTAMIG